jgi:hypothetical protein
VLAEDGAGTVKRSVTLAVPVVPLDVMAAAAPGECADGTLDAPEHPAACVARAQTTMQRRDNMLRPPSGK